MLWCVGRYVTRERSQRQGWRGAKDDDDAERTWSCPSFQLGLSFSALILRHWTVISSGSKGECSEVACSAIGGGVYASTTFMRKEGVDELGTYVFGWGVVCGWHAGFCRLRFSVWWDWAFGEE